MENKLEGYTSVHERIKQFRNDLSVNYSLVTEILEFKEDTILIKASVIDRGGFVVATGISYEEKKWMPEGFENSFVEVAETSAWGRALGNLGYGIDKAIATIEEVTLKEEEVDEVLSGIAELKDEFEINAYYEQYKGEMEGKRKNLFNKLITKRKRELE